MGKTLEEYIQEEKETDEIRRSGIYLNEIEIIRQTGFSKEEFDKWSDNVPSGNMIYDATGDTLYLVRRSGLKKPIWKEDIEEDLLRMECTREAFDMLRSTASMLQQTIKEKDAEIARLKRGVTCDDF